MKVGLIGLGPGGQRVAEALLASSWCDLVAVGGRKSKRIEQFTEAHPDIAAYDDFRSLIVENTLDALFVAIPPFLRGKYLALAADRRLPVWMLTPPARRFDEALSLVEQFKHAECPLVIWRRWGIESALQDDVLSANRVGRIFFAKGNVMTCWEEDFDWRGDALRAEGGVLLHRGYAMMDTLVQVMGIPSTVYTAAEGVSRPDGNHPYDTEDTVAVVCQYPNGAIATISACWTTGPESSVLSFYGTAGSVEIESAQVTCRNRAGETITAQYERPDNPISASVEDFLTTLSSNPGRLRSTMRDHLATMAVVQATYLSARTGQPESPSIIFDMHHVKEADVLNG